MAFAGYPPYEPSPEEEAYYRHRELHENCRGLDCKVGGPLEDCPEQDIMICYTCGPHIMWIDESTAVRRQVVSEGPVVNERLDPTQSYNLACGHRTAAF